MSGSRQNFARQSAWMVVATLAGVVGMTLVHMVVSRKGGSDAYAEFKALLAVFYLVGAAQGALWNLFGQQTAAALDDARAGAVAGAARRVGAAIAVFGGILGVVLLMGGDSLAARLGVSGAAALWATLGLAVAQLFVAVLRGLLQGRQNFTVLGWVGILDGFGRLVAVVLLFALLGGGAAAAISGALIGNLAAIAVGLWGARELLRLRGGVFVWRAFFLRFLPLLGAAAAGQVLTQIDNAFLKAHVPGDWELGIRYSPAAQIGFALTQFTVPLALVMFPKVARSAAAAAGDADALLRLTFLATLALGGLAAIGCTVIPWLPVRILFGPIDPVLATPLVPWFAWSMLAFTLGNVLLSNLLARERFGIIPWLLLLAGIYLAALFLGIRPRLAAWGPDTGLLRVVQLLGLCNLAFLALGAVFSRRS